MALINKGVTARTPNSLLRNKFVNLAPSNATTGNTAQLFVGPGYIKHIYFLTQQDMDGFDWKTVSSNRDEVKMSLYDTGDPTLNNLSGTDLLYEQVVPQGIPDGVLQEFLDGFLEKFNAFQIWIDDNLIGDNSTCADHETDGYYTGTLAQECHATSGSDECRKLNRLICYFNWGLDKVVDFATGYHYPKSGSTGPCVGRHTTPDAISDVSNSESDYSGVTLSNACGGVACTKLNDLVCKYNWAMVKLDDTAIGTSSGCSSTGANSCTTNCSGTNRVLCYVNYMMKSVYAASLTWHYTIGGNSFLGATLPEWSFGFTLNVGGYIDSAGGPSASSVNSGWLDYITWEVPTRNYVSQNWAPSKGFIAPQAGSAQAAQQFDFDNYNRNQGFQITFPEPGLYFSKGCVVRQNSDNSTVGGSLAPTHTNIIYQQTSTGLNARSGIINA